MTKHPGHTKTLEEQMSFRQAGDAFVVRGFASRPELDRVGEIVDTVAYATGLPRSVPLLHQHDPRQAIGTLHLLEARPEGLWVEGTIGRGFEPADTVRKQVAQGILDKF